MKIHEYNEMMAYLTRPAVNRTGYGEGDLVKKFQLKEVLSRYGITPTDSNFARVVKRLGIEISSGGTQPVYIEPSVEKLQEMKKQFDLDQLKSSYLSKAGKEAFEQRKIKIAEIIREADGDITLKQIQNFFKDGKVPQYPVVHEVSKNIGIDIIDSRKKGPLNVKTKEIIKDLNILKNNDKLNAIINKPGFDVVEDLLELEKITAEAIPNSKASPARRVAQLLMAYSGDDPELKSYVEKGGFKISDDLAMAADTITPGMRSSGEYSLIRHLDRMAAEQKGAIAIGKEETGFFASQRKRLQEAIKGIAPESIRKLMDKKIFFQIDEIKPISGMRSNTPIYNIFTQGILKELNKKKLNVLDKETTKAELALQKEPNKGKKLKIIEEYNEKVSKFVKDANKNLKPGELPVRAFELSLDAPKDAIKNTEAYTQYKDYFDDIHTRHGYSFKVPKDVMTSEQAQTFLASGKGKSIILKKIKSLLQSADTNQITKIREVLGCPRLFSSGGRVGFVKGGNLLACPMKKLAENPEAVLNKIGQEMPQTRSPITNMFKKLGMGSMKWAGNTFNVALGPTGVVGLNYFLGVDPTKTADRIGLEAELAFAKPLVEGAKSVTDKIKTPFLRKAAETAAGIRIPSLPGRAAIMTPANALRLARIASPIGWAALGAEGIYHGGKYMLERKKLLESLTDEQRDELLRKEKQEAVMQQTRGDPEAFDYLAAAEGGRVGFNEGSKPKSPSKRLFLKGLGALAVLPVVGKFFKLGKVLEKAQPYTGPAIEKIKGMPEWFPSLVKKLYTEGEDVTKQVAYKDRQIVKRGTLEDGDSVDMIYDLETGDVSIEVGKKGFGDTSSGAYNQEYGLEYKKGQADETTKGQKPPDEFYVSDTELHRSGPEPDDVEFYGNETSVDDAISDLTELEAFAKNKTTKQIHKKKGTKPKDLNPSEPDVDWDDIYNPYD